MIALLAAGVQTVAQSVNARRAIAEYATGAGTAQVDAGFVGIATTQWWIQIASLAADAQIMARSLNARYAIAEYVGMAQASVDFAGPMRFGFQRTCLLVY